MITLERLSGCYGCRTLSAMPQYDLDWIDVLRGEAMTVKVKAVRSGEPDAHDRGTHVEVQDEHLYVYGDGALSGGRDVVAVYAAGEWQHAAVENAASS